MFKSALAAVAGGTNPLGFRQAKNVCVILIDGLGADMILQRAGHAPWLASKLRTGPAGYAVFPTTTSSNITSFGTGLMPGEHGIVGHQVFDRDSGAKANLLNGYGSDVLPTTWQPNQTVTELAAEMGVAAYAIGPAEYADSGFTEVTMREVIYLAAEAISERLDRAAEVLSRQKGTISYLYIPELDKLAHRHGWKSEQWVVALEQIDKLLAEFEAALPHGTGLVVTADHGMIDTLEEQQIFLEDAFSAAGGLSWFGGDTRAAYVYLESELAVAGIREALSSFDYALQAVATTELIQQGWFGSVGAASAARLPELILLAKGDYTLFHATQSKPNSWKMVGHHGALSQIELRVPLIRIGV